MAKRTNPIDDAIDEFLRHKCRYSVRHGKSVKRVVRLQENPRELVIAWECACGERVSFSTKTVRDNRSSYWTPLFVSFQSRRLMVKVLAGEMTREKAIEEDGRLNFEFAKAMLTGTNRMRNGPHLGV